MNVTHILGLPLQSGRSYRYLENAPERAIDVFPIVVSPHIIEQTIRDRTAKPDQIEPAVTGYPSGWRYRYWYTGVADMTAKTDA